MMFMHMPLSVALAQTHCQSELLLDFLFVRFQRKASGASNANKSALISLRVLVSGTDGSSPDEMHTTSVGK